MKISALIPVFNEEKTIARIVATLSKETDISEVVVIDDGSTDNTAKVAVQAGAYLISCKDNQGKGAALQAGFDVISSDVVLMLDGDLVGLNHEHIKNLLDPILKNNVDMTVGVFESGRVLTDLAQKVTPFLSGQRAIKTDVLKGIKNVKEAGYGVELAITRHVKKQGQLKFVRLPGLTHIMKEEKMGFARGVLSRTKMYWELIKVLFD